MRPARRALAAFLALLGVASCGGADYTATKTQIMVTVAIPDTALRAQTSQLRVSVSTQRGALWKEEPAITLDASVLRWPVQIPVYPRKASETSYPIEVVVEALAAQGRLAQARVLTHYEPGARGSLPVALFTCAGPDPVCQLEACHGDACRVCSPTGTCAVVGGETPTVPEPDAGPATGVPDGGEGTNPLTDASIDAASTPDGGPAPGDDAGGGSRPCDGDGDGYFAARPDCDASRGSALPDCDDNERSVYPGAPAVCGDGLQNDCGTGAANALLYLGAGETSLIPERPLEVLPSQYAVTVNFAAGRTSPEAKASIAATYQLTPLISGTSADQIALRHFREGADPVQARATLPSDLRWWTSAPRPAWTGSDFAIHGVALSSAGTYASIVLPWDTQSAQASATWQPFPAGCAASGSSSSLMATDTSAFAYLVGDWFTKNSGVVVYQTPTFAHCLPVSGTIGSLGLAANYAVIGGPETSVQFWDLYAKAAVPYALKNPRALSPGLATRDGNSLAVGQGLGMPVLAYATASGVTLERVDLRSGTALRAATLDLPLDPSLLSLRTLSLETVGRGLLLTLFGIGPAATNGQLPGTLRLVLLRVESDFEIAADVSYGLGDGPYDGPRYDVVDPSVSEPWYELVFMRAVGGTLREGRVRYCTAL